MSKKAYDHSFKLLMIGAEDVGKTDILLRLIDDPFNSTKTVVIETGKRIKLQIWDTSGQERFQSLTKAYYRGAMGIFVVYSITNRRSFQHVSKCLRDIREQENEDVRIIILGNNCEDEENRDVTTEAGEELAHEWGVSFLETSSVQNINIEEACITLVKSICMEPRLYESKSGKQLDQTEHELENSRKCSIQ